MRKWPDIISFWLLFSVLFLPVPSCMPVGCAVETCVETRLTMRCPRAVAAKGDNGIMGCVRMSTASRSGEVMLPLYLALARHIGSAVSSAGLPSARKMWGYWSRSSEGPQRQLRHCSSSRMRRV